jgi:WD40 repeat protein
MTAGARASQAARAEAGGSSAMHSLSAPGLILALDAGTGKLMNTMRGHHGPVNALAYRESAQQLFSAGSDGCILLWSSPLLREGGTPASPVLAPTSTAAAADVMILGSDGISLGAAAGGFDYLPLDIEAYR